MSVPSDVGSTEIHGYHLQNEAADERLITLRFHHLSVKGRNSRTVAALRTPWERAVYNEARSAFMQNLRTFVVPLTFF
jgi:hypothetical protein